jgi:hypothetical protein
MPNGNSEVVLSSREIMMGAVQGVMRQVRDIHDDYKGYHQQPKHLEWQVKIEGALAEMAVNKYLGTYWTGAAGKGAPDAPNYDIRMTHLPNGKLCIYHYDTDDLPFVLAAGLNGTYKVCGWFLPKAARVPEYLYDKDPVRDSCWMVPQEDLHSMRTLFKVE